MMTRKKLKWILFSSLIISLILFFFSLPGYSKHVGGSCNAGVVFVILGFLFVLSFLSDWVSIWLILKAFDNKSSSIYAILLSILSCLIALGIACFIYSDDFFLEIQLILTSLLSTFIIMYFAIVSSKIPTKIGSRGNKPDAADF